jgi:hypothetical protein
MIPAWKRLLFTTPMFTRAFTPAEQGSRPPFIGNPMRDTLSLSKSG